MAGSYKHCVKDDGTLHPMLPLIENLGDAKEAIEEMYGMIWFLAFGDVDLVERAQRHYKEGIKMAPGDQTARW